MDLYIGTLTREGGEGILYAVSSDEAGEMHGCVNEYDLTVTPPRLLSRQPIRGNGPCHLAFSPDDRFLVADQRSGVLLLDSRGQPLDFCPSPAPCALPRANIIPVSCRRRSSNTGN